MLVTRLAGEGPGSLRDAVEAEGERIVVFEIGGVVDLEGQDVVVREPHLTLAGETAPSPGITLIRGGLRIETHDVIVRHLRIRPGEAGRGKRSGWEVDALTIAGGKAHDVVIEQCSLSWATDENLTATGPRFDGSTPQSWRRGTARRIAFRNNIVAEGLSHSTHSEGEHSKGTLVHDNVTEVEISGNLYVHNRQRNPLFKGGATGIVANNLIYDPGSKAVHYALRAEEWGTRRFETGQLAVIGNVLKLGPESDPEMPFVLIEGEGPVELGFEDNLMLDRSGAAFSPGEAVRDRAGLARELRVRPWSESIALLPAWQVFERVLRQAGARPWDRDEVDRRILEEVGRGEGGIIDGEQDVGGYPRPAASRTVSHEAGVEDR